MKFEHAQNTLKYKVGGCMRSGKRCIVKICTDTKVEDGDWLDYYSKVEGDTYVQYVSECYILWNNIQKRCSPSYKFQTYNGKRCEFLNFQEFAEWCNNEYGYRNKDEKGNSWHIDKDILGGITSNYSPHSCIFVPASVNMFFLHKDKIREGSTH
jgi:hypothetical protein